MKRKLIINRKVVITEKSPTFIIAEIGINHSGSYDKCKKMIKDHFNLEDRDNEF